MRFICHSYVIQLFHLFQLLHVFIELLHTDTQAITFIYIGRASKTYTCTYMYLYTQSAEERCTYMKICMHRCGKGERTRAKKI
jgi:hypothetical protein